MTEIKYIGVWSLAKISAAIALVIGLIMVIIFVVFGAAFTAASPMMGIPMLKSGAFTVEGVVAIIVLIIVYAIIGFIWGAIAAFIYNTAAGWFGGVEIDLE